jgi:polar amino acid transport system substrate-binding protein
MRYPILTALALILGTQTALAQQVVRMGTEGAYPPFNFINEANQLVGFEIDLGNELCRRANLTCEWVINDWDSIIPNLVAGNYDTIIAAMNITPAREEVIAFTMEYKRADPVAYMALAGADASVIQSGVIAAQSNTFHAAMVADTGATLLEFPTPDETVAAVRSGVADAVLSDRAFLEPWLAESNGAFVFLAEVMPPEGGGNGIGLRQSDTALQETFNRAIAEMQADGSLNALLVQWFGADAPLFD